MKARCPICRTWPDPCSWSYELRAESNLQEIITAVQNHMKTVHRIANPETVLMEPAMGIEIE
jgi:predicted small metal-binding protein